MRDGRSAGEPGGRARAARFRPGGGGSGLRTGHQAGNPFKLVTRAVYPPATGGAPLILEELSRRGVPNYFGPQRQGRDGLNYTIGASLPQDPARRARMPRAKRLWFLHAYQSFLFNRILASRIDRLDRVLAGGWAMKHDNAACFLVEDRVVEQPAARDLVL